MHQFVVALVYDAVGSAKSADDAAAEGEGGAGGDGLGRGEQHQETLACHVLQGQGRN
jgi:hypothetical protein